MDSEHFSVHFYFHSAFSQCVSLPRDVVSNSTTPTDSCTTHKPTFDSNVQGVLRTKMEGGKK